MAVIVDLPKRAGRRSPFTSADWDAIVLAIEQGFLQVPNTGGTVTSIAVSAPTGLTISGSPVTTSGTIAITNNLAAGFVKSAGVAGAFTSVSFIDINTDTTGTLAINKGGTNATTFTANRPVVFNGTSFVSSVTTTTELSYLSGVTSAIQTQLDAKQATITVLPYANGGTAYAATNRQDLLSQLTNASGASAGYVLTSDGTNAAFAAAPSFGTGTANYVSKWNSTTNQTDSQIFDNGTAIGFGVNTITSGFYAEFLGGIILQKSVASTGMGLRVVNTSNDPLSAAYVSLSNADGSQQVALYAQGQGSTENALLATTSNTSLGIGTNSTEKVTITASGDMLIGLTASAPIGNTTRFVVNNASGGSAVSAMELFRNDAKVADFYATSTAVFLTSHTTNLPITIGAGSGAVILNSSTAVELSSISNFSYTNLQAVTSSAATLTLGTTNTVWINIGGATTWTMTNATHRIHFIKNAGSGTITLQGSAGNVYDTSAVASVSILAGESCIATFFGIWYIMKL